MTDSLRREETSVAVTGELDVIAGTYGKPAVTSQLARRFGLFVRCLQDMPSLRSGAVSSAFH
jgi:hypothetical protein